jgi:alpha-tubulin suppressor-like RCC1 family protein
LWSCGANSQGDLGLNDITSRSSPTQIPGTEWSVISAGRLFSAAIKTDGTLWSWGYNYNGQLAQNIISPPRYSSPVQVPGTQWSSVAAGYYGSTALKTDGTLWGWGEASWGQTGQNDKTPRSSPVQIPGTEWSVVSASYLQVIGLKTDGTLWMWGYNNWGNLGQNNRTAYSSPIQIPGTQWSTIFDGGYANTGAFKTDGSLWIWGIGTYGPNGQNNAISYSSPVQVSGTQWLSGRLSVGTYNTLAFKQA